MVESRVRIDDLIRAGPYARRGTLAARTAARFYSTIIFGITFIILLITLWQNRAQPPIVSRLLLAGTVLYLLYFLVGVWLRAASDKVVFHPAAQLVRCQAAVLGISLLIGCLAHFGVRDNDLWLLYVLGTLVLSESVSTAIVILTLGEVAALLFFASWVLPVLWAGQQPALVGNVPILAFLAVRVLWIWLLTFLLHYLMRNLQARQEAFSQHGAWRELIADQLQDEGEPLAQRRLILEGAARVTQARPALWLPRLTGRQLVNDDGEIAGPLVEKVAFDLGQSAVVFGPAWRRTLGSRLRIAIGHRLPAASLRGVLVLPDAPAVPDALAQVFIPIAKPGAGSEAVGVLELTYSGKVNANFIFQLELDNQRVQDFMADLYALLTLSLKNERLQLLNELALAWEAPLDAAATAAEVVRQVVGRLGFDFATVSLVEVEHHRVYCAAERNAGWRSEASHDLEENDVQCLVVREGRTIINTGEYTPYLDHSIWEKHNHRATTRIWVPIGRRQGKGPEAVLGTIEAGFHHTHCREIPRYLTALLEGYAAMVYPVLLNAREQTRNQQLLDALEALHELGAALREKAAVLLPQGMARLIGQSAERILHADIVMVFLPHNNRRHPKLNYMTGWTPETTSPDGRGFRPYLSEALEERLSAERAPYFRPHATSDPTLVKLGPDGRPLPDGRSFTERHNVRSFAGVPLIGPDGGILGYVCLDYLVHHEFSPEMRHVFRVFAEHAAAALHQANNRHLAVDVAIAHERNILAAEVHNRLSAGLACDQTLAQTAMAYLQEGDPRLRGKLEELLASIADNKAALHETVHDVRGLRNPVIDFSSSLRAQVELQHNRHRGKIILIEEADPAVVVPPAVRSGLLSMLREALGNAVSHAPGSKIEVSYHASLPDGVLLVVADDGPGFDQERLPDLGRHGWFSLNTVALEIGAILSLASIPGRGTTVSVQISCQSLEEHHE